MKELFTTYFSLVIGKFHTDEQKLKLLRLLAQVYEVDYDDATAMIRELDHQHIRSKIECWNWLFLNQLLLSDDDEEADEEMIDVVCALRDAYENAPNNLSAWHWHLTLMLEEQLFELAMYEYCRGERVKAIDRLKKLVKQRDLLAVECLTVLCLEEKMHEEAYLYALMAQDAYESMGLPVKTWIASAIQQAESTLPGDRAEYIRNTLPSIFSPKPAIGFTAQL